MKGDGKFDVSRPGETSLDRKRLGALGEDVAAAHLKELGFSIIERNLRIRGGELDIVALEDDTLAVVEVKTRLSGEIFRPRDSVTRGKASQIRKLAQAYVQKNKKHGKRKVRFDVVEVIIDENTLASTEVTLLRRFFD
ncbi:YraN family protein [bacterium]|nr:YraN family protein [bacterium]